MLRTLFIYCLCYFKTQSKLQLENVYLRKQLEILNRSNRKIKIKNQDRLFFVFMKSIFNRWRESLIIIKPETVIKWHRKGFKLY
jgi:putative transposase